MSDGRFRSIIIAAALLCVAANAGAQTPARDSFLGLDKPKHFLLSAFVESASFASFEAAGAGRRPAMAAAVSLTALVGVGREIHDRKTKGLFSIYDLTWDALGAGAAALMLR